MKKGITLHFGFLIIIFVVLASLITLLVSGTAIFFIRNSTITKDMVKNVEATALELSSRAETYLSSVEQVILPLNQIRFMVDRDELDSLINTIVYRQDLISSLYLIDEKGQSVAVGRKEKGDPSSKYYRGIDFSYNSLYTSLKNDSTPLWSDKFISIFEGNITIGVGIKYKNQAAIAELALDSLLTIVKSAAGENIRVLVIDRQGELVVDTVEHSRSGILNVRNHPYISAVFNKHKLPDVINLYGSDYHASYAKSEKLGWYFFTCIPAGFDNKQVQATLLDIILMFISFLIIALLITPIWSNFLSHQVNILKKQTMKIADGEENIIIKPGFIDEFNNLAKNFNIISQKVTERETALRDLNQKLEDRILGRTIELRVNNLELKASLDKIKNMQRILIRNEKQAALGRMVAGVAHEMNTPIGNAVMAISKLQEDKKTLDKEMKSGLKKSSLEYFLENSDKGLEIAEKNLQRAAELIISFKHVASDQSSSIKRKFSLDIFFDELLLTLHPMLKRSPHKIETNIEKNIQLESYPGVLGQVVTNLITNTLFHAWKENESGTITIRAKRRTSPMFNELNNKEKSWLRISVSDDGNGIPERIKDNIFEPFFTTRSGQGGTGLGLNIVYNNITNLLGGFVDLESEVNKGSTFFIDIPLNVPELLDDYSE